LTGEQAAVSGVYGSHYRARSGRLRRPSSEG